MRILKWCLGILLCAFVGQYLLALSLPSLIMETLHRQGGARAGYNTMVINPVPDETSREVVRPSPDLLYAICIYNLEEGALLIEAPVPERYWSMQFYQMNTDNFAGITNQRDEKHRTGSTVNVTLVGPDDSSTDYPGELIRSPTRRGIILLRASAIGDRLPQQTALEKSSCRPA